LNVDHLVVTGDITATAEEADFQLARKIFAGYGLLNPRRMSVTIGNHDVFGGVHAAEEILDFPRRCRKTNVRRKVEMFVESFGELFRGTVVASERHTFPYLKSLGGVVLVGMNSVAEYSSVRNPVGANGAVDQKQQERLDRLLSSSPFNHLRKIVLIHHHFNKVESEAIGTMHSVWQMIEQQTMKLRGKKDLMDLFRKHSVDAVLHGHYHQNMEYSRKGLRFVNGGGSVLSLSPSVLHLNVLRVSDAGVEVQMHEMPSLTLNADRPALPASVPALSSHAAA
jgi:3',5'-cyclic AMP phosphodiesterase CpdA